MKRLIAASAVILLTWAAASAQADSYDSMPWSYRLALAELVVSGTVTRGGVNEAELRVEKIWKGKCASTITLRRFADAFSANPRPVHQGDRCILLLACPRHNRPPNDPSWECLNPYDGRFDVRDGKAYGSLEQGFQQHEYPVAQVEEAITRGLPPITLEIKAHRDHIQHGEPLILQVTVRNLSRRAVTLSSRDLRTATVTAVIPEPHRGLLDIYTLSYVSGMLRVARVPLTLHRGKTWVSTRRVGTVEYKWRRIPFPVGVSRVRLQLWLNKPPSEAWSNSVVIHVGTKAQREGPKASR